MRTAGSALANIFRELDERKVISFFDCKHLPYKKSKLKNSSIWNQSYKICTARDPYVNTISLYFRMSQYHNTSCIPNLNKEQKKEFKSNLKKHIYSNNGNNTLTQEIKRQHDILFNESGNLWADFIFRLEDGISGVNKILEGLNLMKEAEACKHYSFFIKQNNKKPSIDVDEWLDKETKNLVYNLRKKEFENFNYCI